MKWSPFFTSIIHCLTQPADHDFYPRLVKVTLCGGGWQTSPARPDTRPAIWSHHPTRDHLRIISDDRQPPLTRRVLWPCAAPLPLQWIGLSLREHGGERPPPTARPATDPQLSPSRSLPCWAIAEGAAPVVVLQDHQQLGFKKLLRRNRISAGRTREPKTIKT